MRGFPIFLFFYEIEIGIEIEMEMELNSVKCPFSVVIRYVCPLDSIDVVRENVRIYIFVERESVWYNV